MRISKLDGLRGVFSLMIVFFHYDPRILPTYFGENFIIRESWIFVEFFFVLSGFVISYNYNQISKIEDLKLFIKKRLIRLYPLLLVTTLIFYFFESFSNLFLSQFINSPESLSSLTFKTIDTLLLTNSTPLFGSSGGMNGPSWSISSEMISYLIYGVVLFFVSSKIKNYVFLSLIILSGVISFISVTDLDLSFLRGIISFSLGVFLQQLNSKNYRIPNMLELFIPIIICFSMYMLNNSSGLLHTFHSIVTINFFFFLSIGILLKSNGILSKILETNFLQFLGKISYSIYLNNLIIITIISRLVFKVFNFEYSDFNQMLIFILSVLIVVLYSNITYKYIELKSGKYLKNKSF